MKNSLTTISFILITLLSTQAQSVNPSALTGTWALDYTATLAGINSTGQAKYDGLPQASKTYLQSSMDGLTITFASNGNYTLSSPDGDELSGAWQWAASGNILEVTLSGAGTKQEPVESLDTDNLVLHIEDPGNTKVVFHTWYMEKQ